MNEDTTIEISSLEKRWLYALKIKSWPKLLVPFIFGQSLGFAYAKDFQWVLCLFAFFYTVNLLFFIVLLNDYADEPVDRLKRSMFPDSGSPKTIPDGILNAKSLLVVGIASGVLSVVISVYIGFMWDRFFLGPLSILSLCIFLAYSFRPVRLNYRGGGEFLEMGGVGFYLPFINYYWQSGNIEIVPFISFFIFSIGTALASAIASGLSDEESDRKGGKTTLVTFLGNSISRKAIEIIIVISFLAFIVLYLLQNSLLIQNIIFVILQTLFFFIHFYLLKKESPSAITNAWTSQTKYKNILHKLIWGSFLITSIFIIINK